MGVPLIDLKAQYATIRDEIRPVVDEVMESQYFINGPKVVALEEACAAYCQTPHAVGVSSGTDALLIALMNEGIGAGDEVIVPVYSFFATAGTVSRSGATPVFVDIEPVGYNIDVTKIEAAITPKTRAIIPVHLYGQMADMDPIMEIAGRHNLFVIEDAAQAIGSEYKGKRAGSIGDYGCFSFFPTKNLGGFGDGGLVTTKDEAKAAKLRAMRMHGETQRYHHAYVGGNFRIDALQAAVLEVKLRHLDSWTEGRQKNADRLREGFAAAGIVLEPADADAVSGSNKLIPPAELPERRHIYNQFIVRADRRDDLIAHLKDKGVGHAIYYPVPFHEQACFADLGYQPGQFPVAEAASKTTLALPVYSELPAEQVQEVIDTVAAFYTA